jgi:hypothetical protein
MTTSPMDPIGIPPEAVRLNPTAKAVHIGPPPGISDAECGTPEVLVGLTEEGYTTLSDFWRPTPAQLATLRDGGFIELRQYSSQMVMHSLTVYRSDEPAGVREVDAAGSAPGTWSREVDGQVRTLIVTESEDGVVYITTEALGHLLELAGFVRTSPETASEVDA